MKKTVIAGLTASAFLFQPGVEPFAKATAKVPSHAYLYVPPPSQPGQVHPIDYVEVIVKQPGTIRYIACNQVDTSHLPNTPAGLSDLIAAPDCWRVGFIPAGSTDEATQFFHERQGDRYVIVFSGISWGVQDYPSSGPTRIESSIKSVIFDPGHMDTLNLSFTGISIPLGSNPKAYTGRIAEILAYDAKIDYPQIPEQPIQQ